MDENPNYKLVFHTISTNGVFTLCALDLQYPELRIFEKCEGMFFDSCPIHNNSDYLKVVKAYSLVMQHLYDSQNLNFFSRNFSKFWANASFIYDTVRDNTLIKIGYVSLENVSPFHYILHHPNLPKVISFVYSDADIVCDAEVIKSFEDTVRYRGRDVISTRFKDSLHVAHFPKYPKQYIGQIDEFMKRIEKKIEQPVQEEFLAKL